MIKVLELNQNGGQHEAALRGLRHASGEWLVILDADLQDPPEAIPTLLARARTGFDAVFAGRRGRYQSGLRMLTSRAYRVALSRLIPVPPDAGMFVALRGSAVRSLVELNGPPSQVVAMIAAAGLRSTSVPVPRQPATSGRSAYTTGLRLRSALRAFRWAWWWHTSRPVEERRRMHNESQRHYFEDQPKPNMVPRRSRYLERHVDELFSFAALSEGERVLEVGCGMGRYTHRLAERGLVLTGIDIAPALLDRLQSSFRTGESVKLIAADVLDPPPELHGSFDAVVGLFVLHHLHDLAACMRSIAGLLRPGGRVAFLEPNAYNPLYYLQIVATPTMSWKGDGGMARMRPRVLLGAMRAAGLEELRLQRFGFLPSFVTERPRGSTLERRLELTAPLRPVRAFQLVGGRLR